ncbi:MAG TPA: DUF5947 family protein [Blastocatellia bacterium]|jgi:hypothetical protein|nr:DUF5947 family protein [Blastocatellia bacterium]
MDLVERTSPNGAFAALRRFAPAGKVVERCDFCSAELGEVHQHLIEPEQRRLVCVCDACAILFGNRGETSYRRVPRRILYLSDFRLTDAQWEGLLIPIQLAFFFHSSPTGRVVALYPSPAGPTESLLDLAMWDEIARDNPALERMSSDVEGLLVNRTGRAAGAPDYFIAPIDECFRLVGLIRANWRGLSGGEEVWKEIGWFFADLKTRSYEVREEAPRAGNEIRD